MWHINVHIPEMMCVLIKLKAQAVFCIPFHSICLLAFFYIHEGLPAISGGGFQSHLSTASYD